MRTFPPKQQYLNGYSVECNRSKEIKTRLPSEAIQQMSAIVLNIKLRNHVSVSVCCNTSLSRQFQTDRVLKAENLWNTA